MGIPRCKFERSETSYCSFLDLYVRATDRRQAAPAPQIETGKAIPQKRGLHLPGHRHTKSKEDSRTQAVDFAQPLPPRPTLSREESYNSLRREGTLSLQYQSSSPSAMSSRSTLVNQTPVTGRPISPTPSSSGSFSNMAPKSPVVTSGKRIGFLKGFDKFRGRKPDDNNKRENLRESPSTSAPPQKQREKSIAQPLGKRSKPDANQQRGNGTSNPAEPKSSKGLRGLRIGHSSGKDRSESIAEPDTSGSLFKLDTNLNDMEGIVSGNAPMTPPGPNDIFGSFPAGEETQKAKAAEPAAAAWETPDSWIVKKIPDENMSRLREIDENGEVLEEDDGAPYRVRIFRADSTFAVLSAGINASVAEVINLIGKKTFLQDDLNNYHIVMRKHETSRQLDPQERPLAIQKRLLEQAGYTKADRIEDLGGDDNSYLCRFTFLPAKLTGFTSLEKDPGFNKMQKFSHIDLQGRNLITIPITLYQKATEIISINLSRNLNLDVPKDFINACTNLRELKYTSNEAWKLPQSISLASRLTALDISNNKLEQLEHADLEKLQGLHSLRLSNNRLTVMPKYFGQYKALRSLNLASNSLTEFPDYMCEIKTLIDLDISFNAISELPNIGKLTKLERLWATNNRLSGSFPASTTNLVNVREIDIRHNAIDNIDVLSQLSKLEFLYVGYNSVTGFEGAFDSIRSLHMNHNPVTRFGISAPIPSLTSLNLEKAKLAALPDDLFQKLASLKNLNLDQNHFVSLSPHIGTLLALEHFTIARNILSSLPPDIGRLTELRTLDLRENNLGTVPPQIWFCRKLETLNISSNCLTTFPKPGAPLPAAPEPQVSTPAVNGAPLGKPAVDGEDGLGNLEDFQLRRPSQVSGYMGALSTSPNQSRKGSVGSVNSTYALGSPPGTAGRKASTASTITPLTRKDSSLSTRLLNTFAVSLRHLFLADNRLPDEAIDELQWLPELRILNLSYNLFYDFPPRVLRRWPNLMELYLSGNDLTSLPSEDLEEISNLRVLHINNNKFQVLPAEIAKIQKLAIMDVGSNLLKYNVSNWPYDWNWNWNHNLRYLNLSGNKRLEIKPSTTTARGGKDLTDFTSLKNLRVLGLMDVTLTIPSVPDQNEDRRVRTSGSQVGSLAYGMADSLGRNEHLSTMDMVIDRFRSHDDETILGMFDGQALSGGGSKIAKYLYENFKHRFAEELEKTQQDENAGDALRRTYLSLNKEIALASMNIQEYKVTPGTHRPSIAMPEFGEEDLRSGCVATVLYLKESELYISNVGDIAALLIKSEGGHKVITCKHDPTDTSERQRVRDAGGFVSRHGKLNDVLEVSRAFGFTQFQPSIIAAPHVSQISLKESDEMILIASRELWNYMTREFAVDVARQERGDLMRAAQKLRDLAIAFGATSKIMVMLLGVSDLRRKERARYRTHSMSISPSGILSDDYLVPRSRNRRGADNIDDQRIARLGQEVDAPVGEVSLVFTDIKNSTLLWETYPIAMRSAIKMHNECMRRQLRIIGGYEVKTEGDAFMVSFPTVTSALLWCFTMQNELLNLEWPTEILSSINGQEVCDIDGNIIFRGLSVRMGIHWGKPVCETDPVTKRMDYFGPMVNRAARISSVADGGQITVSSDFIAEIQRLLETHIESDRSDSTGSDESMAEDLMNHAIRRELRSLSSQGFEVKDLGERRLKGLENPEYIYLMYPHALSGRLLVQQQRLEQEAAQSQALLRTRDTQLTIDAENVFDLWAVSLRLEMLCSTLENPGSTTLKAPETAMLERMKKNGEEITDRFIVNFVEHQISRIEVRLPIFPADLQSNLLTIIDRRASRRSCSGTWSARSNRACSRRRAPCPKSSRPSPARCRSCKPSNRMPALRSKKRHDY